MDYEYSEFYWTFDKGDGGKYSVGQWGGENETTAREYFWSSNQREFMADLQKWRDQGWEPISEVGPAAVTLRNLGSKFLHYDVVNYELASIRVKIRKPKS